MKPKRLVTTYHEITPYTDWKTQYIRYRIGRLKHQYWLWNRKKRDQYCIDWYDRIILQNCKPGNTVFYASSGYYLRELFPDIIVAEEHPVVETFVDNVYIAHRKDLHKVLPVKADNFAVVNNRRDQWYTPELMRENVKAYVQTMNPGCRFFYSFRDTQIVGFNRLTQDIKEFWINWAKSLEQEVGLRLVWHSVELPAKQQDGAGNYDAMENPDTVNGNIKFMFVLNDEPWEVKL